MSFLNGLFLAALPLIAVPVLIHLYRGRQRDVIPWGAMQFLTQATTKGRNLERLEELLLMALRVAAIMALIFALAQPLIRSTWWAAGNASEVVLIVDNSLSMARTADDFSVWDQLIENTQEVLDELGSRDRVHLLLASGSGEWLTAEGISADNTGKSRLKTLVENIEPTLGTAKLLDSLQRAIHTEAEGKPKYRRIVVLTDDQTNSWQLEAKGAWQQLEIARQNSETPTAIEIIECSPNEIELNNLAVMQLDASSKMTQPNELIEFSALVNNVGQVTSQSTTVQWLIDDKVVATTNLVELQPNQSTHNNTSLRLEHPGLYAITCRVEQPDQIAPDQQASVVVEISDRLPVLLVHDQPHDKNVKSANELFMAALGYDHGEAQPWHSVYHPKSIASNELASATLSDYRCIVIADLHDFEAEVFDRLSEYAANGGALWLALGSQTNRNSFNQTWYDDGQGPSPVAIELLNTIADTNVSASMIHPPSPEHPATVHLANTTQLDIDEARLDQYWQLVPSEDQKSALSVILESANGSPLVVENFYGQGRVFIQAFPLGLEWSNLPQLKSYVVMIHDWLDYLTAGSTARYNLTPGSSIVASPPAGTRFATSELVAPDGKEHTLVVQSTTDGAKLLRFSQTQQPGLYRVAFKSAGETVASLPFYVARDATESQWKVLSDEDRKTLATATELHFGTNSSMDSEQLQTIPPEEPIWGFLLLLLIGLLACELFLSNWLGRQRSGVAVSTI